jgi:PAS domain S-box-containing protein
MVQFDMALQQRSNNLPHLVQDDRPLVFPAQASDWRISKIFEETADSVIVTDPQGRIEYVNPAFERLTGYSRAEALGQNPRLLKSGTHDAVFYRHLWETILRGETFTSEMTNRKKNGELYRILVTISPLHDAQEEISHYIVTGQELSERDLEGEPIRQMEQSILHTLDHMLVGCMLIGFNWEYLYVNEVAARQAHGRREDFLGRKVMEVQPGIEQTPLFAYYHESLVKRIPQHFEAENPFLDGSQSWYEFRIELAAEGIFVLCTDVTACEQAAITLKQLITSSEPASPDQAQP